MATPGERFKAYIDGLGVSWADRLGLWAGHFIAGGLAGILDKIGTKASEQLAPAIKELEKGGVPPTLELIIKELKTPTGEISALSGMGFLNRVVGGIKGDIFEYFTRALTHTFSYSADFYLPKPELLISNYLRGISPSKDYLYAKMRDHGIPPEDTDKLLQSIKVLFPSDIVGPAWLRDKQKYGMYWDDVYKLTGLDKGLRQDQMRIEMLQELAYHMPSVRDVVGFLAHEVFEPDMIAKYGLDDEWEKLDKTLFEKVGLKEPMALNYWRDHWQHASWGQITEMLHRGEVTEQDVYDWFRLVEIPPYWRKGLTALMWNLPGRVELRMMAQYGLVNKQFCVDLLKKDGLAEEYRDVAADMMIVRGIRSDLQTRYTKKWLDSAGVRAEIDKAGLSKDIGDRLYQWIVTNTKPDRTAAEKDLTVAQVTKAVRRGDIAWNDGILRLREQGYDEVEADLVMMQSVEVVEAEPTTELNIRVDTIRRQRRQRLITRDQEIVSLLDLGLDSGLAIAYADNDDLRLVKETAGGS